MGSPRVSGSPRNLRCIPPPLPRQIITCVALMICHGNPLQMTQISMATLILPLNPKRLLLGYISL